MLFVKGFQTIKNSRGLFVHMDSERGVLFVWIWEKE